MKQFKAFLAGLLLLVIFQILLEYTKFESNGEKCNFDDKPIAQHISKWPPEDMIQQAKERSQRINDFRPSTSDILLGRLNPKLFNASDVSPLFRSSHFPDINIIGLPKAGTSHLYHLLSSHPNLTQFHKGKEFCLNDNKVEFQELTGLYRKINLTSNNYHALLERALELLRKANDGGSWLPRSPNKRTINGCVGYFQNVLLQRQYLQRKDAKYILLVRDPAEWTWAAYNYWFWQYMDTSPSNVHLLASAPFHYRSPELFHEYMLAGERSWAFKSLMNKIRNEWASWVIVLAREVIDKESLLVLKVEDFAPAVVMESGVLGKLSNFLGIDSSGFELDIVKSYGNCGDQRGAIVCMRKSDAYGITGGRGMLEKTRELVYFHFAQECIYWAEQFNIIYSECLEAGSRYLSG